MREGDTQKCPRCGLVFRVLADEYNQHGCPSCGWEPGFAIFPGDECDPPDNYDEDDEDEEGDYFVRRGIEIDVRDGRRTFPPSMYQ